ncbi:MAG: DUF3293 domain-containing protein [Microthrixaceae bacterium]|nr:DUF3293 domain-containing protein [Microthrixaceae bacterium]
MTIDDIWAAYADTRVTIHLPEGSIVVTPTDGGDGTLDETWHVITAHNPESVQLSDEENQRRHDELVEALIAAGRVVVPAAGQGLDGRWPAEESVAVRGIDTAAAVELGRQFGQLAIFRAGPDRIFVIDCHDAAVRSSRPIAVTRLHSDEH